jgi:ferric-dicitrate binding protein FerR (iron transport regulator)
MKTKHSETIFFRNAAKYLANEMNEEEMLAFVQSNEYSANINLLMEMKRDWNTIGRSAENTTVDTDSAWSNMLAKMGSEKPSNAQSATPRIPLTLWVRVAAAALLLFIVGTLYIIFPLQGNAELIALTTGSEQNGAQVHTLPDGSIVYLGKNTTLTFPKNFTGKTRPVTLNGEAFFEVMPNRNVPFRIDGQSAIVEVVGTSFNVKTAQGEAFEIQVETGVVQVFGISNPEVKHTVTAGEQLTAQATGFIKTPYQRGAFALKAHSRIHFKDETLERVLNVVNRNYNANITVASKGIAERRITVAFESSSIDTIVDVLCLSLALEAKSSDGAIVLYEKE